MQDGYELFDMNVAEETEDKSEKKSEKKKSNIIIIGLSALVALLSVCVVFLMIDKLSDNNYKIIVVDTNADKYNQVQIVDSEEEFSELLSVAAQTTVSENTTASQSSENATSAAATTSQLSEPVQASKININTASAAQLIQLKGIGEKKAQAIVDYRNENGAFGSIDEIKKVSGIGDKIFEGIKDYITVG